MLAAAVTIACVAITVSNGAAAQAHPGEGGSVVFSAPQQLRLPIGGATRMVEANVHTDDVINPQVVFHLGDLADVATVEFPADCVTAGDRVTCPLAESGDNPFTFRVTPAEKAEPGAQGKIHMTVGALDFGPFIVPDLTITLDDGVDLTVAEFAAGGQVQPKQELQVPAPLVANVGNKTAAGLRVTFGIGDPTIVPKRYDDCTYTDTAVTCDVPVELPPGHEVELPAFDFSTTGDALGLKGIWVSVAALEEADADAVAAKAADGWAADATARQTAAGVAQEVNPDDNGAEYAFEVVNTYDVESLGATATGAVGDVVKVVVGARNNGPGTLDATRAQEYVWRFFFTVPQGAEVVTVPDRCAGKVVDGDSYEYVPGRAGATLYQCHHEGYRFPVGTSTTVEFSLKITQVIADAAGNVSPINPDATEQRPADANTTNDNAPVVINPTAAGSGGGASLPITGANAVAMAGVGFGLVLAGGALYLVSRRRRPDGAEQ
jgi:LPXTG-motif cell wall-anchored protein